MPRKGQMFVITMIFLAAMIFTVQSLLFTYNEIDLSHPPQNLDAYVVENMETMFQKALDSSTDCLEVKDNILLLKNIISDKIGSGQEIKVTGNINCSSGGGWPSTGPDLGIQILITRESGETWSSLELYRT
jgi:hypothetical protein